MGRCFLVFGWPLVRRRMRTICWGPVLLAVVVKLAPRNAHLSESPPLAANCSLRPLSGASAEALLVACVSCSLGSLLCAFASPSHPRCCSTVFVRSLQSRHSRLKGHAFDWAKSSPANFWPPAFCNRKLTFALVAIPKVIILAPS